LLFAELLQAHRKRPKTSGEKVVDPIFRPFFVGLRRFLRALAKTRQTAQICLDSKNLDAETAGRWRPTAGSGLRVVRGSGSAPALRRHAPTGSGD